MSLTLETPRLLIRPWNDSIADIENAISLAKDVGYVCFSMPGQLVATHEAARELIKDRMDLYKTKRVGKFLVLLKETNEPIGTCGIGAYQLDGREEMELGYRFCLKHWGKGYATEASNALLTYGFQDLKLNRIIAFAIKENPASLKVIEKLSFDFVKEFDHADLPHRLYELKRENYLQNRGANPRDEFQFLYDLELKLMSPSIRKNKNELDELLAPTFFEHGSSGKLWSRKNIIEALLNEKELKVEASNFAAHRISDNAVLVTYKTREIGSSSESLRSSIWKNNRGKWQMFFHQGTRLLITD